jgi:hypothetical protein
MIGMALGRIRATLDAWEESKHPRRPDGKFGKGGGSSKSKSGGTRRSKPSKGVYSTLNSLHREDIDEVLKTPFGSKLRGEMGHTLIPGEAIKAMDIRDKYRKGEMSREDARNKLAAMYKGYHEEYDKKDGKAAPATKPLNAQEKTELRAAMRAVNKGQKKLTKQEWKDSLKLYERAKAAGQLDDNGFVIK